MIEVRKTTINKFYPLRMLIPKQKNICFFHKADLNAFQGTELSICSLTTMDSTLNLLTKDITRKCSNVWKLSTLLLNYP